MSATSTISIERIDGTKTSIYCNYDGYVEHNGIILQMFYPTPDLIENLLSLGDLYTLSYFAEPIIEFPHTYDNPQENVCIAYHRDMGEDFHQSDSIQDYNYIFNERNLLWYVIHNGERKMLEKAIWRLSDDLFEGIHTMKIKCLKQALLARTYIDKI